MEQHIPEETNPPIVSKKQKYPALKYIQILLHTESTEEEWKSLIQRINWKRMPKKIFRVIALEVCDHVYGQDIFQIALKQEVLCFDDFKQIPRTWRNRNITLTEYTMHCAHKTALQSGKSIHEANEIEIAIANAGYPSWMAIHTMVG